ncbi:ferredoxin--NADP reductase [Pelagibius sp. Alg239-R121]|uniref:ferredoxin--NADP reductase n=1 Tax=Pelagibius sp. Alg239-R121 TaxID=2993448 RepID=UPI0024A60FB2|nr:ferredoxin--NADP reductase [Pelagibius sp. Alg239-R121]
MTQAAPQATRSFHKLRVGETRLEIGGSAKTIVFDLPGALCETFRWRPGQHLTLRFNLSGEELRRSYSISSSPFSDDRRLSMRITVKRVEGGRISNHINDNLKAGDKVEVMPPFGGFCLDPGAMRRRTHYFFGAGSGITPLFAMIQSVLSDEPHSVVHLVDGNRNAATILFKDELDRLCDAYPGRLSVSHLLSSPSLWSGFRPWRKGKIDAAAIEAVFAEYPPYAQDVQYYICGPGDMNRFVRTALTSLDVPVSRIHMESYGGAVAQDDTIKGMAATARVTLGDSTQSIEVAEGQTLLEAARAAGLTPPFSCQSGVCGACRARLVKGSAEMRARMALEDTEISKGVVLTCQSLATSSELEVVYE